MVRNRIVIALLAVNLLGVACMSREEKLIDRRHRLRATLDELYEAYADRDRPKDGHGDEAGSEGGVVGRLLAGVDRAHFDEYCLAIGRGERSFTFSGKLETFMKTPKNARACRQAAEIQVGIEELERETGAR